MRVLARPLVRLGDLYAFKVPDRLLVRAFPRDATMRDDHFCNLLSDCCHGIECRERFLEDHANAAPSDRAELLFAHGRDLVPLETD